MTRTFLNPNEKLRSPSGQFELYLQTDGLLVVKDTVADNITWESHDTPWPNASNAKLNFFDGDLTINNNGTVLWGTDTYNNIQGDNMAPVRLEMRDDGNFALVATTGFTVWLSGLPPPVPPPDDPNVATAGATLGPGWTFLATENLDSVFYFGYPPPGVTVDVAYGNPANGPAGEFEQKINITGRVEFSNRSKWSTNHPDSPDGTGGNYWPNGQAII